ncbi:MAG: WYL domain-containing protein [Syntrophobacteraceae bacterium]|nr:WYL domain-containing protein [Syntrophobacteraceae bacterium]
MGARLYLERFVWFDSQIRKGRYPNATKLALAFECSVKTAQRTIETFRDRFSAPIEYCPVKRGYFYRDENFRLPVAQLSDTELLAILVSRKLLEDAAAGILGNELGKVAARLGKLLAENLSGSVDLDAAFSFRWTAITPCDSEVFQEVLTALIQCRLLTFHYYSPHADRCTVRTVEPHHLVNYQGAWHLVAWCRLRGDWRDFVLARISRCAVDTGSFEPRPPALWRSFLEGTFGIFQGQELFEVTLRFSPDLARWARGQCWHPAQRVTERESGELDLTLPVSHETEILMEILKYGSRVEVLEPAPLRCRVRKEMEAMLEKYRR